MILNQAEKKYLSNRLPALELSYEPKLHKKVYAPVYYIIPKGPKALIWYTYWKEQNVCLLIKLNERGNYSDVQLFPTTFSNSLALGTIIYGTYFLHYNRHYFTCEQLYYYKGQDVAKKPYQERLDLLLNMFTKEVDQVLYTADSLVVGLPVLTETYEEAFGLLEQLPYKTYGIAVPFMPLKEQVSAPPALAIHMPAIHMPAIHMPAIHMPAIHTPALLVNQAVFKVKADLAADNYQLYTTEDHLYDTALVPTYKCSVMLNSLFRQIKENANLDLLEESDDEDEFENTKIDKFVDLEKTVLMECVYSKRFKKWQPVKTVFGGHLKIISSKDLQHFYKK